jgi:7,8-dihydropterin-6-yl-methyl-4-(beta-D-ribofuranosyl)aminobenzene 5'-phosphate synthase
MIMKAELRSLKITVLAEDSVAYESPYLGQHGISLLLTAQRDGLERNVLVDVAQNPDALLENMAKMGIAASCIDTVVLPHCHYDHTQGLGRMLKEIGKKDLPVIAHPDIFRLNFITDPYLRHVGVMKGDRREDISLVAHVRGKGLVIITGCSHAGIVNIVKQAVTITGTDKVHGIIGSFHLIEAPVDRIQKTAQALKEFNPDWVYAGHCTGFRAQVELFQILKDRFSPLHTGIIVEIQ